MEQGKDMMKSGMTNKKICDNFYRNTALFCFGSLGASIQKELPHCIVFQIQDALTAESGTSYVGYKPALGKSEHHVWIYIFSKECRSKLDTYFIVDLCFGSFPWISCPVVLDRYLDIPCIRLSAQTIGWLWCIVYVCLCCPRFLKNTFLPVLDCFV